MLSGIKRAGERTKSIIEKYGFATEEKKVRKLSARSPERKAGPV